MYIHTHFRLATCVGILFIQNILLFFWSPAPYPELVSRGWKQCLEVLSLSGEGGGECMIVEVRGGGVAQIGAEGSISLSGVGGGRMAAARAR